MKAIKTEQLTKFYGKARGINDVNLSVEQGDFCGTIEMKYLSVGAVFTAVGVIAAFLKYRKKDIG